ncbi:MAG TPA: SirB1 family protein [Arenimonas sp.]|nr:SirB1 family protein [Arenimonas sp.]
MSTRIELPDWRQLGQLGDDELPLLETALLIARDEYPELDANAYIAEIDAFAAALAAQLDRDLDLPARLTAINRYLFSELGFAGNDGDYDDPRNSYLNQVLERRLGIPISLAFVQIAVMRRLGMPLDGVSFPGHFLVRLPVDDGLLILDPFNQGRPVSAEELRDRASSHMGGQHPDDSELLRILAPASHRAMLVRMLRNLKGLYLESQDWERVARSADRLLAIAPDTADALRDRGLAYHAIGHAAGARSDLGRYLQLLPEAGDRDAIRTTLIELGGQRSRLN